MDEIVEANILAMPSKSFKFPYADTYTFMAIPIESYSSESPEFLVMIQEMGAFSFTCHLEFIPESNLSLVEFDVCHPRHLIYLILLSLGVMFRVLTAFACCTY